MRRFTLIGSILVCLLAVLAAVSVSARDHWNFFGHSSRHIEGSGNETTVTRDVTGFDRIESSIGADIDITIGDSYKVTLTCDDNLVDLITTKVRGRTLEVDAHDSFSTRRNARLEIVLPKLTRLSIDGSGKISINKLSGDEFTLSIGGSADVTSDGSVRDLKIDVAGSGSATFTALACDHVDVELAGSGEISLAGISKELSIEIPGSGDLDSRDLKCEDVIADISGSGHVDVFASETLEGSVSGSGDIRYWGNPQDVSRSISGHGRIAKGR
jgi:hypothetical protein